MRRALVSGTLVVAAGCNAILGLDAKQLGALGDAGVATNDAGSCASDVAGASDPASAGCWSTFDLTRVSPALAAAPGCEGAAFDGRYLYLAPAPGAIVVRFDTSLSFEDPASWSTFDTKAELGVTPRFLGAVFDGRWVTFVPHDTSPLVVRYDTTARFDDRAAWSTFDPTSIQPSAVGFAGATFDGRFTYLVPHEHSVLLRHDSQSADGAGWEPFDVATVHAGTLAAYWGGVFDGRAVYLAGEGDGVLLRYDIQQPFGAATSWAAFDTSAFHASGLSFAGGAFDGRYVYFAPGGSDSFIVRFDSQGVFSDTAAWTAVDLAPLSPVLGFFSGAIFDGRFVYVTPTGTTNGQSNRHLARYDTTMSFDAMSSWQIVDLGSFGGAAVGASAFDGQYVYFMPDRGDAIVTRFEARNTPKRLSLPAFFGSFF